MFDDTAYWHPLKQTHSDLFLRNGRSRRRVEKDGITHPSCGLVTARSFRLLAYFVGDNDENLVYLLQCRPAVRPFCKAFDPLERLVCDGSEHITQQLSANVIG